MRKRRALKQHANRRKEMSAIRVLLAGVALDLEAIRLERTLRRKFSPDQPRAAAEQPDGGRSVPADGGGQSAGGQSGGSQEDIAGREQSVLDGGTRDLSLRIRSGP